MELADNLYGYIWDGQDNNCNSFLFKGALKGGKHVIVDPGHVKTQSTKENAIQMLLSKINADEINPRDIGFVLLTHSHPDHVESAMGLRAQLGSQIAIHKADFASFSQYRGVADIFLDEGDIIFESEDAILKLQVIHTPGHTPGHIALYNSDLKALIAGDLIFYHSTGRSDLPGGDPDQLKASVQRVSELDVEILMCGHPYGHPGILNSKEEVVENFEFIKERTV